MKFRSSNRRSGNYYLSNKKQNCCQKSNFRVAHKNEAAGAAAATAVAGELL